MLVTLIYLGGRDKMTLTYTGIVERSSIYRLFGTHFLVCITLCVCVCGGGGGIERERDKKSVKIKPKAINLDKHAKNTI
jgi:hypothetical protein